MGDYRERVLAQVAACKIKMANRETHFLQDIDRRGDCTPGQREQLAAYVRRICKQTKRFEYLVCADKIAEVRLLTALLPIATRELTAINLGQPDPQAADNHLRVAMSDLVLDMSELSFIVHRIGADLTSGLLAVQRVRVEDDTALRLALDFFALDAPIFFRAFEQEYVRKIGSAFAGMFVEHLGRLEFYRVKETGIHVPFALRGLSSGDLCAFLFDGVAGDALAQAGAPGYQLPIYNLSIYENQDAVIATGDEARVGAIHTKIEEWTRELSAMDPKERAIVTEEARICRHEATHLMRRMGEIGEVISPRAGVRYDLGLAYEEKMLGGVCGLRNPKRVYSLDIQKLPIVFRD
jgi:hypothetical protein